MAMVDDGLVGKWAAANHGLLLLEWLLSIGVTRREVDRRLHDGVWIAVHPGVYRVAGAPITWEQRLHAACLAAGTDAAVSHRAALAWWGLDGGRPGAVEIAVPRPQWPRLDGGLKV